MLTVTAAVMLLGIGWFAAYLRLTLMLEDRRHNYLEEHPGCLQIERMLARGEHPTRRQVRAILGPPIHLHDCGTKDPIPYPHDAMWKAHYWGYGWREYTLPVIIDFDANGRVIRLRHGWA